MDSAAQRAPTIDDLRVKLCWICREEETQNEAQAPGPSKLWVHPCSCTLVAHQDCLLEWIKESQQQPSRRDNALKCPQCGTKYIIDSQNPLMLRILDRLDRIAYRGGKYAAVGLVTGILFTFAGSICGLCVLYGAHAVRVFVGDRMYNIIVGEDSKEWSWSVYCNLSLVPFYLIASRLRIVEGAVYSSITLPVLLSLTFPSPSTLASSHQQISLPRFLLTYPPTPALCIMVYPFVRSWYTLLRKRVRNWVLQIEPSENRANGAGPRDEWVLEDHDHVNDVDGRIMGADLRIDVDLQPRRQPNQNQAPEGEQNENQEGMPNQEPGRGRRRMRLTFASIGRFITRSLATPWIASAVGKVLELAARHSLLLRRVLAINRPYRQLGWMESIEANTLRKLKFGYKTPWHQQAMEHVWWRNTLGLSLWVVSRDVVTLLHLFLRKRELQSRRILSQSFAGIDVGTLDLISPAAF